MENYMNYIEVNPKIMFGKPTIRGTRITVEAILEDLAAGKTPENLLSAYPSLQEEAIRAALIFAADALKGERVYSMTA